MVDTKNSILQMSLSVSLCHCTGFPGGSMIKNSTAMQETWVQSLGQEYLLEKEMATHSSILAWEIPRTVVWRATEPIGLQRAGHN